MAESIHFYVGEWPPDVYVATAASMYLDERGVLRVDIEAITDTHLEVTGSDVRLLRVSSDDQWLDQAGLDQAGLDALVVMQVHDELVFEVAEGDVAPLVDAPPGLMAGVAELDVPLVVEAGVGQTWDETH